MKLLQHIIIGCLFGLSVSYVIVTMSALLKDNYFLSGVDLFKQLLLALILGVVIGAATLIIETERWPFRVVVFIHFLIVVASVYSAGAFGDWYDIGNFKSMFILFCEVVLIYIIVWCIMLLLEKKEIETINKLIKRK